MTQPNFLIIQADQLTSQVLSAYGHPVAKTPNIDRLAGRGSVFRNAYCSYPLCGPSRMSMMTGRLASRIGAFDNASEFRSEMPTFAHYLRAIGYRTVLSGKMHFVGADQLHGFEERLTTDIYPGDFYWTENLESRDEKHKSDDRGVTHCGVCD
ncbi:MAG: sulfatase-like hydrolase/transferase, partial [Pseudomonadota bacterium]